MDTTQLVKGVLDLAVLAVVASVALAGVLGFSSDAWAQSCGATLPYGLTAFCPNSPAVATQVNNRLMIYPAPIFLFVAAIYLVLCTSLDGAARWLLTRRPRSERIAQATTGRTESAR